MVLFIEFENVGKTIMNMDSAIRFVTILDTNDEKVLFSEHKTGATDYLSKEESQESLQFVINTWKTRSKLTSKIGKGKYVLAEYEKIKRITMPLDENHLLYITTEVGCNALSLVDKVRKL
jgi:ribosomal protein S2